MISCSRSVSKSALRDKSAVGFGSSKRTCLQAQMKCAEAILSLTNGPFCNLSDLRRNFCFRCWSAISS